MRCAFPLQVAYSTLLRMLQHRQEMAFNDFLINVMSGHLENAVAVTDES